MALLNTSDRFGSLTKLLHWAFFVLFVVQFYLVYRREYFPKGSPEKSLYMMLHESIGVTLFFLAIIMIVLRQLATRPVMPANMTSREISLAKAMHFLLYATMLFQPLSGMLMSMLGGYPVPFFGWFELPNFFEENKALSENFFEIHVWTSYLIIGLVSLHTLAAFYHHFYRKDEVLRRMLP